MQMQSVVVYKVCINEKVVCSWIETFAYNKLEHCCCSLKALPGKEYLEEYSNATKNRDSVQVGPRCHTPM